MPAVMKRARSAGAFAGVGVLFCLLLLQGCLVRSATTDRTPVREKPSFCRAPFINPTIIKDLTAGPGDSGDQVVSINLLDAQGSNRYAAGVEIDEAAGKNPLVHVGGEDERFSYRYLGETDSGIMVLQVSRWTGGSGVFESLLLLVARRAMGLAVDWDAGLVQPSTERLLLTKLGSVALGDRWQGQIRIKGDTLVVGRDEGWFSGSGGTGGGEEPEGPRVRMLKISPELEPGVGLCD